jgi:hypothetical protein
MEAWRVSDVSSVRVREPGEHMTSKKEKQTWAIREKETKAEESSRKKPS